MLREVKGLRKKKIRLVGVCEAQREMFGRDWRQVETRLHWLEAGSALLSKFRPGLVIAAPLAGVLLPLAFRRKIQFVGMLEALAQAWRLIGRFKSFSRGVGVARQLVTKDWPE
ncbi:MAG: hypothetical protein LBD30_01640 [Verrucomicrobiales bacterium]|jgi:hypothetical protein|nr:hypothetical protein [Verrucomicrobiales bacterium]